MTIQLHDVESRQIHSIGHDPVTNTLAIRFYRGFGQTKVPGSVYHYDNFTADDYAAFAGAESLAKHFDAHIKPQTQKHPFRRIEDAPTPSEETK